MKLKKLEIFGPVFIIIGLLISRYLFPNKITFFTEISIYTIFVMGNNILMGYMGYTSFGQPFYLSCGAYAAALYLAYLGGNVFVAMLFAVLVGLLLSLILGPSLMRLKGSYFTLINASLCAIGVFMFERLLIDITNGNDGLWYRSNMAKTPFLDIRLPQNYFFFIMFVLLAALYIYRKMDKSALGSILKASNSNPRKMRFLGYNVFRIRWLAYTISVVFSTIAGSLYAVNFGFVNPSLGENSRAIEVLLATLIGGIGTVYGPFFGALGFLGMKDFVSSWLSRWEFVVGIMTLVVLFKFNRGLWGLIQDTGSFIFDLSKKYKKESIKTAEK
ncbi:MAG: branched-chain amino acid ABC transporter permease [Spirochaetia bacterium]|jgi:branched-chain amino acid transport system permease protein|nr:branched-chain amino acid ABC transporter permease [Spirochaetia bacterium]